jgi:hypothetical protein
MVRIGKLEAVKIGKVRFVLVTSLLALGKSQTRDGTKVDSLLYSGNNLAKAGLTPAGSHQLAAGRTYSMTSSAVASRVVGIGRPIAFAAFRLITSRNFVGF